MVLVGILCGENPASIRLMEKSGYFRCAHLKNIGEKFGRILDVVMDQKEIGSPRDRCREDDKNPSGSNHQH